MLKTLGIGSWDVEKVHAVVARSTYWSQNAQNTPFSDHFWKLGCRISARRCGTEHISKSKCTKHTRVGPLLEVEMSKKCTPLWREARFEVKMWKARGVRTTFGGSDVVSRARPKGLWTLSKVSKTWGFCSIFNYNHHYHNMLQYTTLKTTLTPSLHCTTLRSITLHYTLHSTPLHYTQLHAFSLHYTTLHYITFHYTTLHSTTLHYTTLHYTYTTFHYTTRQLHYTLHYTTLHYNYTTLHSTTLHYTPLHSTTLNSITRHYTTLNYTTLHTLHSTTLHSITLHYPTLHHTTLHSTTLHYTQYSYNYNYNNTTFTLRYTTLH